MGYNSTLQALSGVAVWVLYEFLSNFLSLSVGVSVFDILSFYTPKIKELGAYRLCPVCLSVIQ